MKFRSLLVFLAFALTALASDEGAPGGYVNLQAITTPPQKGATACLPELWLLLPGKKGPPQLWFYYQPQGGGAVLKTNIGRFEVPKDEKADQKVAPQVWEFVKGAPIEADVQKLTAFPSAAILLSGDDYEKLKAACPAAAGILKTMVKQE